MLGGVSERVQDKAGSRCVRLHAGEPRGVQLSVGQVPAVHVELRGYVFPRVGDALAVTHFPHYTSGVLTPYLFPEVGDTLPGTLLREYSGGLPLCHSFTYMPPSSVARLKSLSLPSSLP